MTTNMQRSATIGVALWGAGEHAQRNLLPALVRCPGINLRGLYTLVPDDAARLAATYGIRNYATPAEMLADGNVQAAIPKRIRPDKAAEAYVRSESPRGELGFYVVSDGTASPYRVKARGPAFVNLSVLPEIARGIMLADLVLIAGSIDIVLGEVDR